MKTVGFRDELTIEKFPQEASNKYVYTPLKKSGIRVKQEEIPYIMTGGQCGGPELLYSTAVQFNGRTVTIPKMEDILDSAQVPLLVKLGRSTFLAGKGFLAKMIDDKPHLLFVATIAKGISNPAMGDVKMYVSRDLQLPANKTIWTAVKSITKSHKGDIIFTSQIADYLFAKLPVPKFKSVQDRKNYTEKIVDETIKKVREERGFTTQKKVEEILKAARMM